MKKSTDLWISLFFIFGGVAIMLGAVDLDVGTPTDPQPGFFPLMAGIILTLVSSVYHLQTWIDKKTEAYTKAYTFGDLRRPFILVLALIVYLFAINALGYLIVTFFLSAVVLWILDTRSWWVLGTISLTLSIGSYLLFDTLLGVFLPMGVFK